MEASANGENPFSYFTKTKADLPIIPSNQPVYHRDPRLRRKSQDTICQAGPSGNASDSFPSGPSYLPKILNLLVGQRRSEGRGRGMGSSVGISVTGQKAEIPRRLGTSGMGASSLVPTGEVRNPNKAISKAWPNRAHKGAAPYERTIAERARVRHNAQRQSPMSKKLAAIRERLDRRAERFGIKPELDAELEAYQAERKNKSATSISRKPLGMDVPRRKLQLDSELDAYMAERKKVSLEAELEDQFKKKLEISSQVYEGMDAE